MFGKKICPECGKEELVVEKPEFVAGDIDYEEAIQKSHCLACKTEFVDIFDLNPVLTRTIKDGKSTTKTYDRF